MPKISEDDPRSKKLANGAYIFACGGMEFLLLNETEEPRGDASWCASYHGGSRHSTAEKLYTHEFCRRYGLSGMSTRLCLMDEIEACCRLDGGAA